MRQVTIGGMDFDAIEDGGHRVERALPECVNGELHLFERQGARRCGMNARVVAVLQLRPHLQLLDIVIHAGWRERRFTAKQSERTDAPAMPELHEDPPTGRV